MTLPRWLLSPRRRRALALIGRADAQRDAGRHEAAAALYGEVLRLRPRHAGVHLQRGHMLRAGGEREAALLHYRMAERLHPGDPEAPFQLGLVLRDLGREAEAECAFERAGRRPAAEAEAAAVPAPELLPRPDLDGAAPDIVGIELFRLGFGRVPAGGALLPGLRGVSAIRGACPIDCDTIELRLDDAVIHHATPGPAIGGRRCFNLWVDLSRQATGVRRLEVRALAGGAVRHAHAEPVAILPPVADDRSDAVLPPLDPGRPVAEQVDALPSMVRAGRRAALAGPPRTVVVQRADQLGDLVVSLPAIRAIRALWPAARLVGLVTAANRPLADALGLFDATVEARFTEVEGRRAMAPAEQARLAAELRAHAPDVAIDLGLNPESRPLLRLSGASVTAGFGLRDFPWLTLAMEGTLRDAGNGGEAAAHGAKLVALVAWIGAMLGDHAAPAPRRESGCYAVLHPGGRLAFARWPHFARLAALMLAETDLELRVLAGDVPELDLPASPRIVRLDAPLPFADLDALLARAAVFVGNDSGPKHLANLRGTPVVSVHMARLNGSEWGQEGGLVVSRRVPCAGCGIHARPEECAAGFACLVHIRPEEVMAAVTRLLNGAGLARE